MTIATLTVLGPLAAMLVILVIRRSIGPLAILGAGVGVLSAVVTLARVAAGAEFAATLPGLPGLPLRLTIDPEAAVLVSMVAVVNLPPKQIGPVRSECLVTGFHDSRGHVALCIPDRDVPLGTRLL